MPAKAFISYSHNDEKMLTALHKHHAVMKREKTISTWYDRDILAGGRVHGDIVDALTSSELFLALVSPDAGSFAELRGHYADRSDSYRALRLDQHTVRTI
jgi:hypothetical protein